MLNKFIFSVICLFLFVIAFDGQSQRLPYDLNGKSTLKLINQTNDSIAISLQSFTIWPSKDNRVKNTLAKKGKLKLELDNQGRNYTLLILDNEAYKIFIQPGSVDTITISATGKEHLIEFSGDSKNINHFLSKKSSHFNSIPVDYIGRSKSYTEGSNSYKRIIQINDSISQLNLSYLQANAADIPKWYIDFDTKKTEYLSAFHKINSALYRKLFQNIEGPVPQGFFEKAISLVDIEDESMLGNSNYMSFLNNLFTFKTHYPFKVERIDKRKQKKERVELMKNELSGIVKDGYLASQFCGFIDNKSLHDSTWIDLVEEKEFHDFLKAYSVNYSILPEGSDLPYFYLRDTSNVLYEPKDFKGEILLINFWNAGCKPCIQDFLHENKLVEKYASEPVTILNICTAPRLWKKMINKHELKTVNLLVEGNWGRKLYEAFDINYLPHSTLVDWNGKIVQNKCARASGNVVELIDQLLIEMKSN